MLPLKTANEADTAPATNLRRHSTIETILGPLPEQADYADYRDVSGAPASQLAARR